MGKTTQCDYHDTEEGRLPRDVESWKRVDSGGPDGRDGGVEGEGIFPSPKDESGRRGRRGNVGVRGYNRDRRAPRLVRRSRSRPRLRGPGPGPCLDRDHSLAYVLPVLVPTGRPLGPFPSPSTDTATQTSRRDLSLGSRLFVPIDVTTPILHRDGNDPPPWCPVSRNRNLSLS